jgi:glutamate-1-semialdehyde 2,1-aminomutase
MHRELFERACRVIPGGVNSPVRSFQAVGGTPVAFLRGAGATVTSVDGRELLDFCCSWGPLILGHAHPKVVEAVCRAAADGMSFGANTRREVAFAELLCQCVPGLEKVRLVNSGTEAVMTALRLARGVTGRRKILKFEGCYHGHADYLLVAAGSGLLTGNVATSAGISPGVLDDVLLAPYNDLAATGARARAAKDDLAAIVVEPIAGNMGLVMPADGFLAGLRQLADETGALLVFDEVITGFRLGPTTYGRMIGITPDLTCLGKIIGGGMPLGAVGGRAAVMDALAPLGKVYQAGTLSGNPVAVAAGHATLALLLEENPYPELARLGRLLAEGLADAARAAGRAFWCPAAGSLFTPFFTAGPVTDLASARRCDTAAFASFFHAMLDAGFYLPPAQFETAFLSTAHTQEQIERFIVAARVIGQ